MEKILFFDAGPIITIVMSRLSHVLPELKKQFGGKFYITPAVKRELVDRPLTIKRFQFEALEVLKLIREGVLEVYEEVPEKKVSRLKNLANATFSIKGKKLDVIQAGEMESIAAAFETKAAGLVIDERTLRLFIEDSSAMKHLLESRFKKTVKADKKKMDEFSKTLNSVTIIRSIELMGVAFKHGYLDAYIPKMKHGREAMLDAVLWTAKYNGCAVTEHEIEELKRSLLKK